MLRRMLFMLGAVVVVVAILAALKFNSIYQQIQQFQAPKPAINVETEVVRRMDWQSRLPAIGTLKASQGIDLSVEIAGTITDVQFQSGEKVSKGQAIVLLDSEMEQASLASAEADLNLSRLEFQRARSLLDRQAISRSEYDRLNAESQKAEASVAQLRASLSKKRILAPFSGTIGIRQVDVGDFIAAGRHLAAEGFTGHDRIVAHGGSAGGMLMGAVANMAPADFAGIIAEVPFVDVLNTMLDATLPLTPPEWPEWGNPVESAEDYRTIAAYSPYDNVTAQAYPPILAVAGLTDPRVTYWEPAKWVARLRALKTGDNPVLFRINMDAGHAGASGRFSRLEEIAYSYAFALKVVGKAS